MVKVQDFSADVFTLAGPGIIRSNGRLDVIRSQFHQELALDFPKKQHFREFIWHQFISLSTIAAYLTDNNTIGYFQSVYSPFSIIYGNSGLRNPACSLLS